MYSEVAETITSVQPLVTAYALQSAWNTAKLSASVRYSTVAGPFTTEVMLDALIVGETGADGKFGGNIPPQTMVYGPYGPNDYFTIPIPTPTVTNTLQWSRQDCSPDFVDPSKFVCQWLAPDPVNFGVKTTAISTINALAVTTISQTTAYTMTRYSFPTSNEGHNGNAFPYPYPYPGPGLFFSSPSAIFLVVLAVILGLVILCPLLACCIVVWPREIRRNRQRTRLRQLWLERRSPYDLPMSVDTGVDAERGPADGEIHREPRTPTEATPFMASLPHSPGPPQPPVQQAEEMQQRVTLMEEEIRRLRDRLERRDDVATLPRKEQAVASGSNVRLDD